MTAHRSLSRTIRNKFIAGLVIVIPIVLTVKALWWLFSYVDSLAAPLALRLLAVGTAIGLAGAWLAGKAMETILFRVPPFNPTTLTAAAAILGAVALTACLLPTHRAAKISPLEALSTD